MSHAYNSNNQKADSQDMRIYILDNGHLECDANMVVAGTVVGTKENKTPRIKWIKIPTYVVLIDHPKEKILFDLGTNSDNIYPEVLNSLFPYYFHENQRLENQLALVGLKPEDISTIILSHLHFDHFGNYPLFRHADFYLHPQELKDNPDISIENTHFVKKDSVLFPGIEVITLPGHTNGLLGMMLHLKKEGTLIFPSDATYTSENFGPPAKPSGTVYNSIAYYQSVEKLYQLKEKYHAEIMFSHDMDQYETLKKAPLYYE